MDLQTFRKKLIQNRVSKTAFYILLALTAVFLALGAVFYSAGRSDAESLEGREEKEGAFGYVDAAAFDEWVCKYGDDTYYVLYDESGDLHLAVIDRLTMNRMTRQAVDTQDVTHLFDDTFRLTGTVRRVSSQVPPLVEEVYGLPSGAYRDYFRSYYIDTTESPGSDTAWMLWTFAIFSGLFTLVSLAVWAGQERPFNRECRDYAEEEFAEAARMMDEADRKQKVIFGEKMLISRDPAMLVRYSDILWIHLVKTTINGVDAGMSVGIHTRCRNSYKLAPAVRNSDEELDDMMNRILEKVPDVLVGYNDENKRVYDDMTRN